MGIVNYVRNGRRFGDRKMLTGGQNQKNEPPGVRYLRAPAILEAIDLRSALESQLERAVSAL